jgi:predicted DNA-binding transcriptional regulator AlpA
MLVICMGTHQQAEMPMQTHLSDGASALAIDAIARKPTTVASEADDEMMSLAQTRAFFGGPDRPIHASTLYRGIAAMPPRYPKPVRVGPNSVRWLRSECRAARQALIDARDGAQQPAAA